MIGSFNIHHIINAPSAAAIVYELDKKSTRERNILVFIWAVVLVTSLLTIEEGILDRRAVQEFKSRFNKDLISNVCFLCRLKKHCECTKRILSASTQAYIGLLEDINFYASLTRARFEDLN